MSRYDVLMNEFAKKIKIGGLVMVKAHWHSGKIISGQFGIIMEGLQDSSGQRDTMFYNVFLQNEMVDIPVHVDNILETF